MRSWSLLLGIGFVLGACQGGAADPEVSAPGSSATAESLIPSSTVEVEVSPPARIEPPLVNFALDASLAASSSLPDQPLSMIRDGIRTLEDGNWWGAGDFAPQWVELDLGVTTTIRRVELVVSQSPAGRTVHEIVGRGDPDEGWQHLVSISGETVDGETLIVEPEKAWQGVRFLRIETIESPSWVAWGEIEIWGSPSAATANGDPEETLPADGPDLILVNANVITVDAMFSRAEAVAVRDGRVEAVGSSEDVLSRRGADTVVVDLAGATVLPGIVDPHIHLLQHEAPDQEAMAVAQETLIESGRTTVGIPGVDPAIFEGFVEFDERAVIRIRLYVLYNTNCGEPPADPDFWRSVAFDDDPVARVGIAGVKVFADGGSCHGPAVSWEYPATFPSGIPFDDWVGNGSLFVTPEELAEVVVETGARGGQVVVHAAGDRAVVAVLDGMALALGDAGNAERHRMDHNDFVPPEHRSRYGELGVVPVVFGDYDSCFEPAGMWSLLVPPEPLSWHRANRTLIEANPGFPVAWHSDLPFTRTDVFAQMQFLVNVAEVTEHGSYCEAPEFLSDEGVGIEQAIRMMTWNAAYAMNMENSVGSLEPGKWADLIIVQEDPLALPDDRVFDNTLWATMIGGVTHYCRATTAICDLLLR